MSLSEEQINKLALLTSLLKRFKLVLHGAYHIQTVLDFSRFDGRLETVALWHEGRQMGTIYQHELLKSELLNGRWSVEADEGSYDFALALVRYVDQPELEAHSKRSKMVYAPVHQMRIVHTNHSAHPAEYTGLNVLVTREDWISSLEKQTVRVYFTSGPVKSAEVLKLALSYGWADKESTEDERAEYVGRKTEYEWEVAHPKWPEIDVRSESGRPSNKDWFVGILMLLEGYEHNWLVLIKAPSREEAHRTALIGCCHCDEEDIIWSEDKREVTCTITGCRYSIDGITIAPVRS